MTDDPEHLPAFGTPGRCLKCGRPIDPSETMCEVCNQAGMTAPAATQMHGTVAVAIIGAVIGLGVLASVLVGDPGPYPGSVVGFEPSARAGDVEVTVTVTNEGTRAGRARCEMTARDAAGREVARDVVVSPEIPAAESVEFTATLADLATEPAEVEVRCQ
jgi:hypothetical protein